MSDRMSIWKAIFILLTTRWTRVSGDLLRAHKKVDDIFWITWGLEKFFVAIVSIPLFVFGLIYGPITDIEYISMLLVFSFSTGLYTGFLCMCVVWITIHTSAKIIDRNIHKASLETLIEIDKCFHTSQFQYDHKYNVREELHKRISSL